MKTNKKNSNDVKNNSSLNSLFINQLKKIYGIEQMLLKKLPVMERSVTSSELKETIEEHIDITETQVKRLDEVFSIIGIAIEAGKSAAIEGIIEEGNELIKETPDSLVRDAAIIAVIQKIEHYEIASYGCLRTWAKLLEYEEASDLLQTTLDEEGEMDEKLTEIAEASVNEEAMMETEAGEE